MLCSICRQIQKIKVVQALIGVSVLYWPFAAEKFMHNLAIN